MVLNKDREDLNDSLKILEDSVKEVKNEKTYHYRTIANQLYTLLIDRGKGPLVKYIIPNFKLHPIYRDKTQLERITNLYDKNSIIYPNLIIMRENGKYESRWYFNMNNNPIKLENWLAQPLISKRITISKLIQDIRRELGAHSSKAYGETTAITRHIKVLGSEIDVISLISIAEYVLNQIKIQLN